MRRADIFYLGLGLLAVFCGLWTTSSLTEYWGRFVLRINDLPHAYAISNLAQVGSPSFRLCCSSSDLLLSVRLSQHGALVNYFQTSTCDCELPSVELPCGVVCADCCGALPARTDMVYGFKVTRGRAAVLVLAAVFALFNTLVIMTAKRIIA